MSGTWHRAKANQPLPSGGFLSVEVRGGGTENSAGLAEPRSPHLADGSSWWDLKGQQHTAGAGSAPRPVFRALVRGARQQSEASHACVLGEAQVTAPACSDL